MPAPNDLTPEEEAEFANHGVPSAGPGREPLGEAPPAQQGQQSQDDGQQGQSSAQDDGQGQQTQQPRDDSGRFASPQQQGQQQQGQQPADQGQQGQQQQGQQQQGQQPEPGQEGDQGGEPRMVPLAALHQERQQRARLAQRVQLAETRLNAMLSRQAPEQQEAMPDINQDPAGYIVALEQRLQRFEQERAETTQNQQLDSSISADEETFTAIRPDYPQASDYFVQSRAQELLAFHPPAEAQKLMLQEAKVVTPQSGLRPSDIGACIPLSK
jgi:hypothetical protein